MQVFLSVVSYIFSVFIFLPLIRDNYWLFRTLEYPRFQKFIAVVTLLCCWTVISFFDQPDFIAIALLLMGGAYLFIKIFPYTTMSKKQVLTVEAAPEENSLKIFTANVYQYNQRYAEMKAEIEGCDPDVILLLETDENWEHGMAGLKKNYPHHVAQSLPNTYGMNFYSRFELVNPEMRFLVKPDIPSLDTKVKLRSGQLIQLYGLHPEPPVPGESLRSTAKDKELMKVALKVSKLNEPCIVLGDLNDVAWSYTTSLFTKVSGLLDVRCGRGFYSTFSAKSKIMRFPLDYIFCSADFGLYKMKRLPANGSDHFPIFTHLVYRPDLKLKQKPRKADSGEKADAVEMANQNPDA
jgi:endonuclease/exonuclease/phosphatase (EEP) superfamily protein YafD